MSSITAYLNGIAEAIQTKKKSTEPINAQDFADEILNLKTGSEPLLLEQKMALSDNIKTGTPIKAGTKITIDFSKLYNVIDNVRGDKYSEPYKALTYDYSISEYSTNGGKQLAPYNGVYYYGRSNWIPILSYNCMTAHADDYNAIFFENHFNVLCLHMYHYNGKFMACLSTGDNSYNDRSYGIKYVLNNKNEWIRVQGANNGLYAYQIISNTVVLCDTSDIWSGRLYGYSSFYDNSSAMASVVNDLPTVTFTLTNDFFPLGTLATVQTAYYYDNYSDRYETDPSTGKTYSIITKIEGPEEE